jgi:hypothetical protein
VSDSKPLVDQYTLTNLYSWVQTDMGNSGAVLFGVEKPPLDVETSVTGTVKVIEQATKETHGGKLWQYDGTLQRF